MKPRMAKRAKTGMSRRQPAQRPEGARRTGRAERAEAVNKVAL
jgi:hypothetical protein